MSEGRRVQGCNGANLCKKGALHPSDAAAGKGAMHCTPYGGASAFAPIPVPDAASASYDAVALKTTSELLAIELAPVCGRLTQAQDICSRRVRTEGIPCGQHRQ